MIKRELPEGVYIQDSGRYIVQIRAGKLRLNLGTYETVEEAQKIRNIAVIKNTVCMEKVIMKGLINHDY